MGKADFNNQWPRLAGAAFDARDSLRNLAPRLDAALQDVDVEGTVRTLLEDLLGIAERHAALLGMALKTPAADRAQPAAQRALWARR